MQMDTGTIIAVAAALIFYLRLIILQRHKANRMMNQQKPTSGNSGKLSSGKQRWEPQPGLHIVSWFLLGMGVALILLGALMTALPIFGQTARDLWWLVLTIGILLLGLSIR